MEGSKLKIKKAILLSGGIDSSCLAYWMKPDYAIHIDYGQRCARAELRAAKAVAKELSIPFELISIDCTSLGSGDLTAKRKLKIAPVSEWWPFRNQMLITFGLMKGISLGIKELIIGAVKSDNKHRDGSAEFFSLMNNVSSYQEGRINIVYPAIDLDSYQLAIQSGISSSVLGWTHSCHKNNIPCGKCHGCQKHIYTKHKINTSNK